LHPQNKRYDLSAMDQNRHLQQLLSLVNYIL
jgi:hypothetical protein